MLSSPWNHIAEMTKVPMKCFHKPNLLLTWCYCAFHRQKILVRMKRGFPSKNCWMSCRRIVQQLPKKTSLCTYVFYVYCTWQMNITCVSKTAQPLMTFESFKLTNVPPWHLAWMMDDQSCSIRITWACYTWCARFHETFCFYQVCVDVFQEEAVPPFAPPHYGCTNGITLNEVFHSFALTWWMHFSIWMKDCSYC